MMKRKRSNLKGVEKGEKELFGGFSWRWRPAYCFTLLGKREVKVPFSMPRGCSPGLRLRPHTVAIIHEILTKLLTSPCFRAPSMSQPCETEGEERRPTVWWLVLKKYKSKDLKPQSQPVLCRVCRTRPFQGTPHKGASQRCSCCASPHLWPFLWANLVKFSPPPSGPASHRAPLQETWAPNGQSPPLSLPLGLSECCFAFCFAGIQAVPPGSLIALGLLQMMMLSQHTSHARQQGTYFLKNNFLITAKILKLRSVRLSCQQINK